MIKNIRTVLSPLLIISYLFGLRIIEYPTGHSRSWLSFLYILIWWLIYYYLVYTKTLFYMNLYSTLHHICQGLNNLTTLLLIVFGLYHTEKFKHCLKKLAIIDVTLKSLGTTINNQQLYIKIIWLVLGWFMSVILINCIHSLYIISQHNYDIVTVICISIILNHCSHINLIEDIMVASILGYIALKFDQINEYLQNLTIDNKHKAIKRAWENPLSDSPQCIFAETRSSKQIIWIIMHLHLELCKISREIDWIFGTQMTFKMGCYFGFMAMNLYELFNVIFINNYTNHSSVFICIQLVWFFHNVLKLIIVNYMCEKVSTKANATKNFANKILCSTCDIEISENITQLLLQMTQSPLRFHGFGLFQFGFKFLHGFAASVLTVLIILIQAHIDK